MNNKQRLIITVVTFLAFALMSVGFATYRVKLNVSGVATLTKNGKIAITNVTLVSYNNISEPGAPTFTDNSIDFNASFRVNNNNQLDREYSATYEITLTNTSFYDYIFASSTFTPNIETTNNENVDVTFTLEGIEVGDKIASNEVKTFTAVLNMYPKSTGEYNVGGSTTLETEQDDVTSSYSLLASIPSNTTIDLRGNTDMEKVTVTVINTFPERKNFTLSNNGKNFSLVDNRGNDLRTLTIAAESTSEYEVYVKRKNGATFPSSPQKINLYFTPNDGTKTGIGTVTIKVDIDETILDEEAPIINDVNAELVSEIGKVKLTWDATDESGLDHSIIEVYNDSDTLVKTITTTNSDTEYTITNLSAGTYYFQVYGVDNSKSKNSGKNQATSCTTSAGFCSRSTSSSYKWIFTVTNSCNGCTFNGANSVNIGETYTATVRAENWYTLGNTITVTMGGKTLAASNYTYNKNNGSISIPNVTGDLNIQVNATFSCLVKGTKILLANGKYKNIEDITYNDLLAVWSFEKGNITYEYPIWLESVSTTNKYLKTTFSDGTTIKTVGLHGLFSPTYNEFISVNDSEKYKVGTKIQKIINGKLKEVTITKIEDINEIVQYYHVVSTRYYNVIANDILTTDGTVILSNLYGFTNTLTWPNSRTNIMNAGVYSYDDFKDILPYYMFKGMRVEEGKFLENFGLSKDLFRYYLLNNQVNETMILPVSTDSKGSRLWMVTTSLDKVNDKNKNRYLHKEGSYYKLPIINGGKKWYSTSENKYYNMGDVIKVNHGMHFILIK